MEPQQAGCGHRNPMHNKIRDGDENIKFNGVNKASALEPWNSKQRFCCLTVNMMRNLALLLASPLIPQKPAPPMQSPSTPPLFLRPLFSLYSFVAKIESLLSFFVSN